jgi:glycosyltransferase involved in cell wall biosynthesis
LTIPLALSFLRLGYEVETFGFTIEGFKRIKGITNHGHISPQEINRLMNSSKFLLDTSSFEGLGLTPLEGLATECVPIVTRNGGLESVKPPRDWMIWLESPYISKAVLSKIIADFENNTKRSPTDLKTWLRELNLSLGISEAVRSLESY